MCRRILVRSVLHHSQGSLADEPLARRTEQRAALIRSVALIRRNALAAPFERAFAIQKSLEANPPSADAPPRDPKADLMTINYRPEEAIYVIPSADRVTVVFSTIFREDVDMVYGRVFLQVRRFSFVFRASSDQGLDGRTGIRRCSKETGDTDCASDPLLQPRTSSRDQPHPRPRADREYGLRHFRFAPSPFTPLSPLTDSRPRTQSSSLGTSRPLTPQPAPSPASSSSATTSTTTSSAQRPTSVRGCAPGPTSS